MLWVDLRKEEKIIKKYLAYNQKIIADGELWIEIMLARNSLSHLYDEETSRAIYDNIKERYIKAFEELEQKFNEIL